MLQITSSYGSICIQGFIFCPCHSNVWPYSDIYCPHVQTAAGVPCQTDSRNFCLLFEYKKYQTNYINLFFNLKKKIPERSVLNRIVWSSRQIPLRDSQQNILNGGSCGWLFTGQSNDQLLLQFGRSSPGSSFLGELRFASFTDSDINFQESRPVLPVVQGDVSPRMLVEQQRLLAWAYHICFPAKLQNRVWGRLPDGFVH